MWVTVSTGAHAIAVTPEKRHLLAAILEESRVYVAGFRCGCVGPGLSSLGRFHLTFIPTCWLPSPALVMARGAPASILPGSAASKKSFSSPVADSCVPVAALIGPIQITGPSRSIPVGHDVMQMGRSWVLGPRLILKLGWRLTLATNHLD